LKQQNSQPGTLLPVEAQSKALIELAKLKVDVSTSQVQVQGYESLILKILAPGELLTPEECEIVTGKDFTKAINAMATGLAKLTRWYQENDAKTMQNFLTPAHITTDSEVISLDSNE